MSEEYCVFLDGKDIGTARVEKSGLYYRISCRCQFESGSMYNLFASCGKKRRKLGICIPKDGQLCLDTSVPVKELGEGCMQFYLEHRNQRHTLKLHQVVPGEPFPYLEDLENAYVKEENGVLIIVFRDSPGESIQALQDSGQIP